MQYDITALGEILIDFTPIGQDDAGDLTPILFPMQRASLKAVAWMFAP